MLSGEDQWVRASGLLATAIERSGHAKSLQAGAAGQLDAADYAFRDLLTELSAAMSIAAAKTPLAPAAVLTPADADAVPDKALAA